MNEKIVKISEEESNKVQELFYGYNALLELLKGIEDTKSALYSDLLVRIKHEKYILERTKDEIVNKYIPEAMTTDKVTNYRFIFTENAIAYEC